MRRYLPILFVPLLVGCQDTQARRENAELSARVAALETQVAELSRAQKDAGESTAPADVVARAAAQNCANDLSRYLETTRQDSGRYPSPALLTLPNACVDLRVDWQKLAADAYRFTVASGEQVLVSQSGP